MTPFCRVWTCVVFEEGFIYAVSVGSLRGEPFMAQWHGISRRKTSGGRRVQARGKRKTEISSEKQFALVGEQAEDLPQGRWQHHGSRDGREPCGHR